MKNSSKKALEKRGIISAGRAAATPGARAHNDKRYANRKTDKQRLKHELQKETARNRGPFPFGWRFPPKISKSRTLNTYTIGAEQSKPIFTNS